MFDDLYSRLTSKVSYKLLAVLPPALAILGLLIIFTRGIPLGIDFQGGTWIEITLDKDIDKQTLAAIENNLVNAGLKDIKLSVGWDIDIQKNKLTIVTTSVVSESDLKPILGKYFSELSELDTATTELSKKPPADLKDKLTARFQYIDVSAQDKKLTIKALDLDEDEMKSALEYYLGEKVDLKVQRKNLNIRSVGPTLGETFRRQGIQAIFLAFLFMGIVVFYTFKTFVSSIAVLQAAINDVLFAVVGMSIFQLPFDSASLGALLMLIGYSVDTDILLTARVLRQKGSEVNARVDDAMKTGLMMTTTTISAMIVTLVVTTFFIQIPTLYSIAAVLLLGLIADMPCTWLTNAGILKWYVEKPKPIKKTKTSRFRFSIFGE